MVVRCRLGVVVVHVDGAAVVVLREELLDLPVVHSGADREFEILLGDGVPVLVDHHDAEQVADSGEEKTVKVVSGGNANLAAESVQDDLANNKEEDAKDDVAKGPAVAERAQDKKNLQHNVDGELDGVEQVENDKEANSVDGAEAGPALERSERNEEANREGDKRADAHHPERQGRAVFVELESYKTVDKKTSNGGVGEAVLNGDKVRIRVAAGGHDTSVDDERDKGEKHIEVEEVEDLLTANSGELATNMQNHDHRHDERNNVHSGRRPLKDDCVCELDVSRVARRLDAHAAACRRASADRGAQRERCILADAGEVAKARHDDGGRAVSCERA